MRIGDGPTMAGMGAERRRPEGEAKPAGLADEVAGAPRDHDFDATGHLSRGFAGMLSELAFGTGALMPALSPNAAERAFREWRDAEPDERFDLLADLEAATAMAA